MRRPHCLALSIAIALLCATRGTAGEFSFQGIGDLDGGDFYSVAHAVSADGKVVTGEGRIGIGPTSTRAFRWTKAEGLVNIGVTPGFDVSHGWGLNADGSVIVGGADDPIGKGLGFMWTQATGMTALPGTNPVALDISADGSTVVGYEAILGSFVAVQWNPSLQEVPSGYTANDVSADGSVVVGWGWRTVPMDRGDRNRIPRRRKTVARGCIARRKRNCRNNWRAGISMDRGRRASKCWPRYRICFLEYGRNHRGIYWSLTQ